MNSFRALLPCFAILIGWNTSSAATTTFPTNREASAPEWNMAEHTNGSLSFHGSVSEGPKRLAKKSSPPGTRLATSSAMGASAESGSTWSLSSYPQDIQNIVRACKGDPKKIFELVRNNVRFQPYRGFRKSPEMVWVTRSGNDADQAHLLQKCLEAAGYNAYFEYGVIFMPAAQMQAWFGADTVAALNNMTGSAGYFGGYDNVSDFYGLEQIWCNLEIGNDVFRLHPAHKTYSEVTGIDLATAMGYTRSGFLSAAAGTESSTFVQGVSEGGVNSYLVNRANTLVQNLRQNHANASVEEIVSGRQITSLTLNPNFSNGFLTPEAIVTGGFDNFAFLDPFEIYTVGSNTYDFTAVLSLAVGILNSSGTGFQSVLAEYTREAAFFTGKTLTTAFSTDGRARILVDNVVVAEEAGALASGNIGVAYFIDHPYRGDAASLYDQLRIFPAQRTGLYVWTFDPGGADQNTLLARSRLKIEEFRRQGRTSISLEITAETLNSLGLDWLRQLAWSSKLTAAHQRYVHIVHHTFALIKQETGFGVDIPSTQVNLARNGVTADTTAFRAATVLIGSAMEHGVIEQNYPGLRAVSTVRYLRENNLLGGKTYLATSSNYNAISSEPDFSNNWSTGFRNVVFPNALSSGNTLVIPQNGFITLDNLTGNGYLSYNANALSAIINPGNLKGGFATTPGYVDFSANPTPLDPTFGPDSISNPESAEPVDLHTGAYVYDRTDLSLGGAESRGLAFSRHYSSLSTGATTAVMGPGWTHSYDSRIAVHTDTPGGMGATTPESAASLIVATFALSDLTRATEVAPESWTAGIVKSKGDPTCRRNVVRSAPSLRRKWGWKP
jgi:hypothetical protein